MCEPSAPQHKAVIRNCTSGVFVIPAQAGIQMSQSRVAAAFAGMTGDGVDRQISALSGRESVCCENGETKRQLSA